MKLQELEAILPSRLLRFNQYPLNGPAYPGDKSMYFTHDVASTKVLFSHGDHEIWIELWIVVDAQALVFAGPTDWLLEGTPWFCRDQQDLIDLLYFKMEEVWGPEPYNTGDPGVGLAAMCAAIPHIPSKPSIKALSPTQDQHPVQQIGGLDLA